MSAATLVSAEEYLSMTDKPNREYRDGVLYPRPIATTSHGIIQSVLAMLLRKLGLQAGSEISLRMSPTKILVPDVIADRVLQDPYPTEPVLLCCEILSPEDRLGATLAKCEEYHAWGVPFTWVIDPVKRAAWEYPANGEPARVTDSLRAGEISVNVAELFSALDC
jgi:Uma2 family endonuclease